ncbi:MAG TPA: phenylalanine--tRNA ligase subunit beta [Chthoniobacteraceae bacterium]|nr:phenylalanine--tRNA ligase subunit beta [Chthoniobacteraceae bacterium]
MKLSFNWLRQYVDLSCTPEELAELLTNTGLEVEKMHTRGVSIEHVVVAQIKESVQHPNADRLSVCQVDDGSGTARQIVCGAKNYQVGDKVPLALPGAVLPGDFKIKVGKLRGVESQGMLCSATELQIAEDAEGLLILPAEARVGAPIGELFPADTIFDLEVTPNRPDLLSHLGIAREVSALCGLELKGVRSRRAELDYSHTVEITAEECPFYSARCINGVTVGPSPAWLRERLESIGLRSINNIVDVTNFVMMEMGQPLHAFDAATLQGDLKVRLAEAGESFPALDGRTYELKPHYLVIADDARAVALAGVMGGQATGVTAATTSIWLESAYFCGSSIRKTSRELGLMSDSSYRFEREVDPAGTIVASQHAAELIMQVAGGTLGELRLGFAAKAQFGFDLKGAADGIEYTTTVPFRKERCTALLGLEIEDDDIEMIFTGFGLRKVEDGWQIPSFRPDLTREIDLIEELVRVVGMEEIPGWQFTRFSAATPADHRYDRVLELRRTLASLGLHEARGLSLISEKALRYDLAGDGAQKIKNPLGEDHTLLRPSLLPGLVEALGRNVRAGEKSIRLFEIGRVFSPDDGEERTYAALLLSGPLSAASWRGGEGRDADIFDMKGLVERLLGERVMSQRLEPGELAVLPVNVEWQGRSIGCVGQLAPAMARELDATAPVIFAEIMLDAWLEQDAAPKRYTEVPRFPAVTRDIAFIAPVGLAHSRIVEALREPKEALLADVALFDVFTDPTGAKVPADKKSLAYSLTYRSPERTLTADEVNAVHGKLKDRLKTGLDVQFRE